MRLLMNPHDDSVAADPPDEELVNHLPDGAALRSGVLSMSAASASLQVSQNRTMAIKIFLMCGSSKYLSI